MHALLLLAALAANDSRGPFDGLRFREIGPASAGGRIDDFAVLESNPDVFYVATATGGLWKTENNGTTFEIQFDDQPTSSIGDVAIAPLDPNLVWVGTGENNNRQSSSWGDGVYKSTDGGKTWRNMGLATSRHIARILLDPTDLDVVYVAALGSLWGAGGERGVYKTTDGGETWTRILHVDDDTGATELLMDPRNPKVLYAATYQRRRATWGFNGGGEGSAIHKTTDGGKNWSRLTEGVPAGPKGRIGLDLYRKNPDVLYARIEHPDEGGVYRSDDAGASWSKRSSVNPRPMYFSQIRVDPNDDQRIYVLGVQLHVSDDGGKTFRDDGASKIHVDFHAMWIDPANTRRILLGGDGGVGISYDRSETYDWLNNMNLGQFYHVSYDMASPYVVCGGLQDNNTWCGPSAVRSRGGIGNDEWFIIGGGDGFVALVDPRDPRIMYAESQNGRMNRVDRLTNERQSIRPEPAEGEAKLRWNWDTPMMLSPHDPATIFVAANKLFRSRDRGYLWEAVSPDLTTNADREELALMGVFGKDTKIAKNDGIADYPTLVAFTESEIQAGLYWAGSEDGLVHVSTDAGATWNEVSKNIPGLPKGTYVSRLAPSRFASERVYATFDGHRLDDFRAYVYVSDDLGKSWVRLSSSLPGGEVARTITEDLVNPDALYLGTERGLFATVDRGRTWHRVKGNLPTVPIYEITLHPRDNDMLIATHGRSLWILDDLAPFQKYGEALASSAHLFAVPEGVQRNAAGDRMRDFEGDRRFFGENPEPGTVLTYWLASDAKEVAIQLRDASGTLVREMKGDDLKDKNKAGMHQVAWDLRREPLPKVKGQENEGRFGPGERGPFVLPGTYQARLLVDGAEASSAALEVEGDPEIEISDADRGRYLETAGKVYDLNRRAIEAANTLTDLDEAVAAAKKNIGKDELSEPASTSMKDVEERVTDLKRRLGVGRRDAGPPPVDDVRGEITRLRGSLLGATALPTEAQHRTLQRLERDLTKTVADVNEALSKASELMKELSEGGFYPSLPKPVSP
ncbi:MAG TPA: hypothetical protein VJ921_15725 [Vicinamibacteria bacterium]|nr:hypothetical protein [Vicinamibacteria bacterium]